jgi:hypothetical protein
MTPRSLEPDLEPVFAQLATDPRFSQTAAEFLREPAASDRHNEFTATCLNHPDDCAACAPHRTMFLASPAGKAQALRTVREGVVVAHRTPLKGRRTSGKKRNS